MRERPFGINQVNSRAAGAVSAASRGSAVLDTPLAGGPLKTLWYAIDEPLADGVRRFQALGADLDNVIINDVPRTLMDVMAALKADLAVFPETRLVVVDTLSILIDPEGLIVDRHG